MGIWEIAAKDPDVLRAKEACEKRASAYSERVRRLYEVCHHHDMAVREAFEDVIYKNPDAVSVVVPSVFNGHARHDFSIGKVIMALFQTTDGYVLKVKRENEQPAYVSLYYTIYSKYEDRIKTILASNEEKTLENTIKDFREIIKEAANADD